MCESVRPILFGMGTRYWLMKFFPENWTKRSSAAATSNQDCVDDAVAEEDMSEDEHGHWLLLVVALCVRFYLQYQVKLSIIDPMIIIIERRMIPHRLPTWSDTSDTKDIDVIAPRLWQIQLTTFGAVEVLFPVLEGLHATSSPAAEAMMLDVVFASSVNNRRAYLGFLLKFFKGYAEVHEDSASLQI
jgi:hypothetical protein